TGTWAKRPSDGFTVRPKISAKSWAEASLSFAGTIRWFNLIAMLGLFCLVVVDNGLSECLVPERDSKPVRTVLSTMVSEPPSPTSQRLHGSQEALEPVSPLSRDISPARQFATSLCV